MTYATRSDLGKWGLPAEALATIPTDTQDAALSSASLIADGYLRRRWNVPLVVYGDDIKQRVCEIAASGLITTLGFSSQGRDDVIIQRAKDAMQWLEMVASRRLHPDVTGGAKTITVESDKPRGW